MPFRIEGFEGVRDEGKDERDPCRLSVLLAVPLVPLVEGRYERTEVMLAVDALQPNGFYEGTRLARRYRSALISFHVRK